MPAFEQTQSDGIVTLCFNDTQESVNKLSERNLVELRSILTNLESKTDIQCLVIKSGKPGIFIAGADINEIKSLTEPSDANAKVTMGQTILTQLANLPFPTIAAIDGACLGGGTELALACTYRVASDNPKTQIGLPEVNLGIIPGFGGTQRLPRTILLQYAVDMILTGKSVDAHKALKIGLVQDVYAQPFFDKHVQTFIKTVIQTPKKIKPKYPPSFTLKLLNKSSIGQKIILKQSKKMLLDKTKGQYPAPLAALDVLSSTRNISIEHGLKIEADAFAQLAVSPISKQLIHLFFINESLKKYTGISTQKPPKPLHAAGVLGAGLMGGGIAWALTNAGLSARIKDLNLEAIKAAFNSAKSIYSGLLKRKKLRPSDLTLKMHSLTGTIDYSGFSKLDVVIEAIVENIDIKKSVFKELESVVSNDCIIASNTSGLSITEMAKALSKPDRFVGMHFFSPVHRMPLVEIIPGQHTSDETITTIVELAKQMKKTPIVVKDVPGFLVNRILIPYINEAVNLLSEGVDPERIDDLMVDFGMPIGPLALADEVGLDVGYKVAKTLQEGYGERMAVSPLFSAIKELDNTLGKKTGKGFYIHSPNGSKKSPNLQIRQLIHAKSAISDTQIVNRLCWMMINEAARCIDENVVESPALCDMAMIMGTGFPPFKGGPLRVADSIGIEKMVNEMTQYASQFGSRFEPCRYLTDLAKKNHSFYSN